MAKGSSLIEAEQLLILPQFRKDTLEPERVITSLKPTYGAGTFQAHSVISRSFFLTQVNADFTYDARIRPKEAIGQPFIGLALMEAGINTAEFGEGGQKISAEAGYIGFVFNPGFNETHSFTSGVATRINYFEINASYFTSIVADVCETTNSRKLDHFHCALTKSEFVRGDKRKILPLHQRIVSDIYNCPVGGSLGDLMLEGSLQQLIAFELMTLSADDQIVKPHVSTRDKDMMNAVRIYLESTFMEAHSLTSLSKNFGTNISKLKKCFKEVFGISVIEFIYNQRMEYAHRLLYEKQMFVTEVASLVGYKNANHFATAFKRKFGVNPSKLRNT